MPPSFGHVFSPLPVHPQCSQVNSRIFQSEYHGYKRFSPAVGSGGRSLDLHLGLSVLLIPVPPLSSSPRRDSRLKPSLPDNFVSHHFPVVGTPTPTPKARCSAPLASIWRARRRFPRGYHPFLGENPSASFSVDLAGLVANDRGQAVVSSLF